MRQALDVQRRPRPVRSQKGAALLLLLVIILMAATYAMIGGLSSKASKIERQSNASISLARAKEALLGFAVTYRDRHPGEVFGFLPCPDTDNDGVAEASCDAIDISVIGRLPWKTLGIEPMRDDSGECLWYAVSGHAKNNFKTDVLNWDTTGQFIIQDTGGSMLAGATTHDRPLAVIFSPHQPLGAQSRNAVGTTECGGSNNAADYFEGLGTFGTATPAANATTTLILSNADSIRNGTNNDQGLWITSKEVFDRIKKRSDFKTDIDSLLSDLGTHLNTHYSSAAADQNKLSAAAIASFRAANTGYASTTQNGTLLTNWADNILYGKGAFTLNGSPTICPAVLFFSGERSAGQTRSSTAEKALVSNYLEAPNTNFPASGNYTGATAFDSSIASSDIVRCIGGYAAQASFANDFASFTPAGAGVTTNTSVPAIPTVTVTEATGLTGGCFWLPQLIPLAGKNFRAYYEYQFGYADPIGAPDRGNGFTVQMVQGTDGPPTTCGTETNMGALGTTDLRGSMSFIVETDVRRDSGDPVENHTAIMLNGSIDHSTGGGTLSTACDGTASGCRHTPRNKFEEGADPPPPAPSFHNQRIEIHTGCNSTCTTCNSTSHVAPNLYAKIRAWVDCLDCSDVVADYVPPGAELITALQDRDFSAAGNWTGSDWVVTGGVLQHSVASANTVSLPVSRLSRAPVSAFNYLVAATVRTTTAGNLTFSLGGATYTTVALTTGSTTAVSATISATTASPLSITPSASWSGSIDNVSLIPKPAIIERCVSLVPPRDALNSVYFGLTGGFRSPAATTQNVTIRSLSLRSD